MTTRSLATRMRLLGALLIVVPMMFSGYGIPVAHAQVTGTNYTSPHFGYAVSWQLPWYVIESDTDANGFDLLGLADSQSFVYFSGGRTISPNPQAVIDDYASQLANDPTSSGFQQLDDAQCAAGGNGSTVAVQCYRFDTTGSDGLPVSYGLMLKAWDLGDGIDLLLEAYTEEPLLPSYLAHWNQFDVYAPGVAVPASENDCEVEAVNGVSFCFDPTISERDRWDIFEGVRLGKDVIVGYFGDPDLGDVQITGLSSVSPFGEGLLATTRARSIAVYAGSRVWQQMAPIERVETMVHEFFHIYQNAMTDGSTAVVPLWFTEGAAEAVGFMATAQIGVTDQTEFYESTAYSLYVKPVTTGLAELHASDSMGAGEYPLVYLAMQYLLGTRGMSISSLGDFYVELQKGASFDAAFETVFGITPDAFAAEFDAWRPNMQQVNQLPDDLWPVEPSAQPSQLTISSAPQQVVPNQQLFFVGATTPLAHCDATVQIGAESYDRPNIANGEGNIYWLFTVPEEAPAGPATFSAACGSTPVSVPFVIGG
ncbi:MAG: hypothetical protein KC438_04390 [Thermomicrobiales bacterium]|nr:hypothetical protein [Thermomicrobiales bacterium]